MSATSANNPFDRMVLNSLERPLSSDINLAESQLDQEVRTFIDGLGLSRAGGTGTVFCDLAVTPRVGGFIGDGFKVIPNTVANNYIKIVPGTGFQDAASDWQSPDLQANIGSVVNLNDLTTLKPLVLTALASEYATGIPIPNTGIGGGNSRIDIIEVRVNRVLGSPSSRDVLNTGTGQFNATSVNKNLSYTLDNTYAVVQQPDTSTTAAIKYKKGVVSVTIDPTVPAVPDTTSGYIKIAEIFVSEANTTFDFSLIKDMRPLYLPRGMLHAAGAIKLAITAAVGKATVLRQTAPPGVKIGAYGTGINSLTMLVVAGNSKFLADNDIAATSGASSGSIALTSQTRTFVLGIGGADLASCTYSAITATDAANLNSATLSGRPMVVAINQPCMRISMAFLGATIGGSGIPEGGSGVWNFTVDAQQ